MKFTLQQIVASPKTSVLGLVGGVLVALAAKPGLETGSLKEWGLAALAVLGPVVLGLFGTDSSKDEPK